MLTLNTRPIDIPREIVPVDETLTEKLRRKTREKDPFIDQSVPVRMSTQTPLAEVYSRVTHFDGLLDDIVTLFEQMSFISLADANGRSHINLNVSTTGGSEALRIRPSFWHTFVRFCNDNISYVSGLAGSFLRGMANGPSDAQLRVCDLCNYLAGVLKSTYLAKTDKGRVPKNVLLRTIKPDSSGVWPNVRQARAVMHVGYRDDINHRWLMEQMLAAAPSADVVGLQFDGDLLCGGALLPDISRVIGDGDDEFGAGLFFFSGEVGNRSCGVTPFLFRRATRVILCVGDSWAVTHAGGHELSDLAKRMSRFVDKQIPMVSTYLDRLIQARSVVFDENTDARAAERVIMAASYRMAMSSSDLRKWLFAVRAERDILADEPLSVFALQMGLARLAHVIDDPTRQMAISRQAGNLADLDWEKVADRARTISDAHLDEVFGAEV